VEKVLRRILQGGPYSLLTKRRTPLIAKSQIDANPALAKIDAAAHEFAEKYPLTKGPADTRKMLEALFEAMKSSTTSEVSGVKAEDFSGYHALAYQEYVNELQQVNEWLDNGAAPAWLKWLTESPALGNPDAPPPDPAKLNFTLIVYMDHNSPVQYRHRVRYPEEQKPSNPQNIYWVRESPNHKIAITPMDKSETTEQTVRQRTRRERAGRGVEPKDGWGPGSSGVAWGGDLTGTMHLNRAHRLTSKFIVPV